MRKRRKVKKPWYKKWMIWFLSIAVVIITVIFVRGYGETEVKKEVQKEVETGSLKVDPSGYFLQYADGKPFFMLADTSWHLFNRFYVEDKGKHNIVEYLDKRKSQGFNTILGVVIPPTEGYWGTNIYGEPPFTNTSPLTPNEAYFARIDKIIDLAAERGMFIGVFPMWSQDTISESAIFKNSPKELKNAYQFGKYLGKRYEGKKNIFWVLGGDMMPEKDGKDYMPVFDAIEKGLKESGGKILTTYHPKWGEEGSGQWFNNKSWFDFNMVQTGHSTNMSYAYQWVAEHYKKYRKPIINGEPPYEDISEGLTEGNPLITDFGVRQAAYWSVFAGAFGHVYGNNNVWQAYMPADYFPDDEFYNTSFFPNLYWYDALDRPGANQMIHIRKLIESRPFFSRIPDQSLITSGQRDDGGHIVSTRAKDRSYAFVYSPYGGNFSVDLSRISGGSVQAWWYNPKDGTASSIGKFPNKGNQAFTAPNAGEGNDWVLVLDNTKKNFPTPGSVDLIQPAKPFKSKTKADK